MTTNGTNAAGWDAAAKASAKAEKKLSKRIEKGPPIEQQHMIELTDVERVRLGEDMADVLESIDECEAEKKLAVSNFNSRLEGLHNSLAEYGRDFRNGKSPKMVTVREEKDFGANVVRIVRLKPREVLSERAMTPGERQAALFPAADIAAAVVAAAGDKPNGVTAPAAPVDASPFDGGAPLPVPEPTDTPAKKAARTRKAKKSAES